MKRLGIILPILAVASLLSFAVAGPDSGQQNAENPVKMGECCVKAATAGEGCCGKDADAVKAKYADYQANEKALDGMHACCATAVVAGEGCCGKDSAALQASYAAKVAGAMAVQASAGACCSSKTTTKVATSTK